MDKVLVYDLSGDEPVELMMFAVDARDAVRNDPARYTLAKPDPAEAVETEADGKPVLDMGGKPVRRRG